MFNHPIVMLVLVLSFLAIVVWLAPKIYRLGKRGFQTLRDRLRGAKPDQPAPSGPSAQPT
jgi:hypothetical protein